MTGDQPTLLTERLVLRPFVLADAPIVQRLAGVRAIADTTLSIPHPYPDGAAETWIQGHARAELGYWVAGSHWGHGYATEAGRAMLEFGFASLNLHRIHAHHLVRNPASGRVLQKLGMRWEGIHRHAARKWDVFEDVAQYAALVTEWPSADSRI